MDQNLIFLGFGFLVLMIGIASFSIQMTMRQTAKQREKGSTARSVEKETLRTEAVAEAIKRDPSLANASTPAELAQLDAEVMAIQKEWQLKRELEAVQTAEQQKMEQEERERVLAQEAEEQRLAAEERARLRKLDSERRAGERAQKIAAMPPFRRFLVRFWIPLSVGIVVFIVIPAIAGVWFLLQAQRERDLLASCDWSNGDLVREIPNWAGEWIKCEGADFRARVVRTAPDSFFTENRIAELLRDESSIVRGVTIARAPLGFLTDERVLDLIADESNLPAIEQVISSNSAAFEPSTLAAVKGASDERVVNLAVDQCAADMPTLTLANKLERREEVMMAWATCEDTYARVWVARYSFAPASILSQLADDQSDDVRLALVKNVNTPQDVLLKYVNDPSVAVRSALAKDPKTPERILVALADDSDHTVRVIVALNERTPRDTLLALTRDEDPRVRSALAGNQDPPIEVLRALLQDGNETVRNQMYYGSDSTLRFLAKEAPTQRERMAAIEKIRLRGQQ